MEAAIKTVDLTKRFGELVAVDHVNFEVEKGKIFEEIYQRVEDDPERKAKLLEILDSSTEQIKVLGEDRFE